MRLLCHTAFPGLARSQPRNRKLARQTPWHHEKKIVREHPQDKKYKHDKLKTALGKVAAQQQASIGWITEGLDDDMNMIGCSDVVLSAIPTSHRSSEKWHQQHMQVLYNSHCLISP